MNDSSNSTIQIIFSLYRGQPGQGKPSQFHYHVFSVYSGFLDSHETKEELDNIFLLPANVLPKLIPNATVFEPSDNRISITSFGLKN